MSSSNGHGPELDERQADELDGQAEIAPVVEFGRYRLFAAETGLVLARAVETCERCQGCGCGTQVEPLPLPDPRRGRMHLISWLTQNANTGLMGGLTRMMQSGNDD